MSAIVMIYGGFCEAGVTAIEVTETSNPDKAEAWVLGLVREGRWLKSADPAVGGLINPAHVARVEATQ
jgi:hypothetical protein